MDHAGASKTRDEQIAVALRIGIVTLALTTAAMHYSLGGMLFLLNAAGYTVLAGAMLVPGSLADRFRWLPRFALLGFTIATIVGWLAIGPRYDFAYLNKTLEVVLVALLVADILHAYGSPTTIARRVRGGVAQLRGADAAGV